MRSSWVLRFLSGMDSSLDGDKMATGNMKAMWALLLSVTVVTALAPSAGAGQFRKPVYYKVGFFNWSVVAADFHHDGNLDLAVGDFDNSLVYLLRGKGDGSFHTPTTFSVPAPLAMAEGDFDGDNLPDLAVLEYPGTLGIYLNQGDGTFHNSANYDLGGSAARLVVADLNGDGHPDIAATVATTQNNGKVMVFFGNGKGRLAKAGSYELPGAPGGIAAGDLNGDHHPDLVVSEFVGDAVAILMNDGHGKFAHTETYSAEGGEPVGVAIAALKRGGYADLVVSVGNGIGVFLGNGDGTFGSVTLYSGKVGRAPKDSVIADFDGDGNLDVATVFGNLSLISRFYGRGDGTFQDAVPTWLKKDEFSSMSLVVADFNKDGLPDLASASHDLVVLLNAQ
jgi:hypothetical protein